MTAALEGVRYARPRDLAEALALIARLQEDGEPFVVSSGGTDVVPGLKQHAAPALTLVSLSAIEALAGIGVADAGRTLRIGARTTVAELAASAEIRRELPGLALAAAKVGSPQIRNRATVGGNLLVNHRCSYFNQSERNRLTHQACFKAGGDHCALVPSARRDRSPVCRARFVSDLAAVLLLMDARLQLAYAGGARTVALADFYLADGIERNQLRADEVVTAIDVALPLPGQYHYEKLRVRNAIDFASLGVALGVATGDRGLVVRIAVIGLDPRPLLFRFSEQDHPGRAALLDAACAEATRAAVPLKQDFFPPAYRKQMVAVLIRRSFQRLAGAP